MSHPGALPCTERWDCSHGRESRRQRAKFQLCESVEVSCKGDRSFSPAQHRICQQLQPLQLRFRRMSSEHHSKPRFGDGAKNLKAPDTFEVDDPIGYSLWKEQFGGERLRERLEGRSPPSRGGTGQVTASARLQKMT